MPVSERMWGFKSPLAHQRRSYWTEAPLTTRTVPMHHRRRRRPTTRRRPMSRVREERPDTRHPPRSPQIPVGPVDEVAESVAESINASTAAPVATGTLWSISTNGLPLKHQSDTLVANIRGRHARDDTVFKPPRVELAQILPLTIPVPSHELAPVTRAVRATGRIHVILAGRSLGAQLSWEPRPLSVKLDGPWVELRPDVSSRARRRNDERCAYLVAGAGSGVMKGQRRW